MKISILFLCGLILTSPVFCEDPPAGPVHNDSPQVEVKNNMVHVTRSGPDGGTTSYVASDRNRETILSQRFYPPELVSPTEMKTRGPVLDLGCGKGAFVLDLLEAGVDAYGLDIRLPDDRKQNRRFYETDAANVDGKNESKGLIAGKYGTIYSTISLFSYESQNEALMVKALKESHRLLKVGGVLRMSSIFKDDVHLFKKYLKDVPGLTLTRQGDLSSDTTDSVYLEFKKTK